MQIGDYFRRVPTPSVWDQGVRSSAMLFQVIYIHPQQRYYTGEYRSPLTGETFRECFDFPTRPNVIQPEAQKRGQWRAGRHWKFIKRKNGF